MSPGAGHALARAPVIRSRGRAIVHGRARAVTPRPASRGAHRDISLVVVQLLTWSVLVHTALGFGVVGPAARRSCSVCVDEFVKNGGCRPRANTFSLVKVDCAYCKTESEANCASAPVGPCASWPCANGGQCLAEGNSAPGASSGVPIGSRRREQSIDKNFTCHCKDGYTGLTCDVMFGTGGSRACPAASFEVSEPACRALGRIEFPLDDEDGNDVFGD